MPDLSLYRTEILTRGRKRSSDGQFPLVRTGWHIVNYGLGEMREPADRVTDEFYATEKEITGHAILGSEEMGSANSVTGGDVLRPVA